MGFDGEWLSAREPFDARARAPRLRDAAASWIASQPGGTVTDLGAGTGATFRYLAPHLPDDVEWTFVDQDRALLDVATASTGARGLCVDLASTLPPLGDLVTASAFFDLVSSAWIERLVDALAGRPLYATLTVDGEDRLDPCDPDDDWVSTAFRRHQTETDKGFGVALGPEAHAVLAQSLRARGYRVDEARSDWVIRSPRKVLGPLLGGMATRASELTGDSARAEAWLDRRLSGSLTVTVGHRDLFALPGAFHS